MTKKRQSNEGRTYLIEEDHYRKMVAAIPDYAIISLDPDGYIMDWNKGAEKLTLYKPEEIIGTHYSKLYLSKDPGHSPPKDFLARVAQEGSKTLEAWRLRKDGTAFCGSITTTVLYDSLDNIIGYSEVTHDFTSVKSAERQQRGINKELEDKIEALTLSEQRYQQMIQEVKDYAIIVLDEGGYIRQWNAGAELIKGYSAEVIGQHISIFYTPDDQRNRLPWFLLDEAAKNGRASHEGWRVRKDKSRFWGYIVITALHDTKGRLIGFTKVTRDLTAKKLAQDKLHTYAAELEVRNRELEQFTYITSHDLQEPLRKIRMFSETARRSIGDDAALKSSLERIDAAAAKMTALIRSVASYASLVRDGSERTPTNLNEVFNQVQADLSKRIEETNATITCGQLPVIQANRQQVAQLFASLLSNALKFSKTNPVVAITSAIVKRDKVMDCTDYLPDGEYHELQFNDNGIGFDQQYHAQVFSIFQRLHSNQVYSGTGVGLALCRKVVENHNGHITVRSAPGKGSTFYVYLPVFSHQSSVGSNQ